MSWKSFVWFLLTLAITVDANIIGDGNRQFHRKARDLAAEGISDCTFNYTSVQGDTCASIASDWGITPQQLLSYNPSLKTDCSGLKVGNSYCVEENFGHGPASPSTTSISLTSPASIASVTSKIVISVTSVASTGPKPTQAGLTSKCIAYYKVQAGDFCSKIVSDYGNTFSLQDFYFWNPAVGSNCEGLFAGYYVCVSVAETSKPQTSNATTTQTAATGGPSPTQPGIASNCVKYYQAVSGDSCTIIADKFGTFTVNHFQEWNPAVGSACGQLFLGYYYCIAIPTTPVEIPSTTTGPTPPASTGPSPVQAGILSSCTEYYQAVSGDTCQTITDKFGTSSLSEFLDWNPAVKPDCSLLFLGYYYCIAIPGTPAARPSPSNPTTSPPSGGPQPQQPGLVGNCNKYYQVKSGDGCDLIAQDNGITSQQFLQWNTGIASNCLNLFLGYYVCVGVQG